MQRNDTHVASVFAQLTLGLIWLGLRAFVTSPVLRAQKVLTLFTFLVGGPFFFTSGKTCILTVALHLRLCHTT